MNDTRSARGGRPAPEWPGDSRLEESANGVEAYQVALEELHTAQEELHQQNEALAAAAVELQAERQRYQALFDFAPDCYLVTDAHGVIREANRAATPLFHAPVEYLVGKPL